MDWLPGQPRLRRSSLLDHPYQKVNLRDTLIAPGMLLVVLTPFLLRVFRMADFWEAAMVMAAVMPAVVMLRVTVDVQKDPTSHNLWPFEIVIAGILGLACALAGTVAGGLACALLGGNAVREKEPREKQQ